MKVLLIRHGQAVDEAPGLGDTGRWLTEKGRKITRKVGRWLGKSDKRRPAAIWTSPLVRAVQTAEIVAEATGFEGEIKACSELLPGRDPGDLIKRITDEPPEGLLCVVGHEPSLSLVASALLGDIGVSSLKKSAALALTWDPTTSKGTASFLYDPAEKKPKKRFGPPPAPPAAEG
jgi:phosphohistidine phosphatase